MERPSAWLVMPAEDDQAHGQHDGDDREEDEAGPDRPRDAVATEQVDQGEATEAMIPAVITGITIVWVSGEQPDRSDQSCRDADQEPGRDAQVPQPLGRRE